MDLDLINISKYPDVLCLQIRDICDSYIKIRKKGNPIWKTLYNNEIFKLSNLNIGTRYDFEVMPQHSNIIRVVSFQTGSIKTHRNTPTIFTGNVSHKIIKHKNPIPITKFKIGGDI